MAATVESLWEELRKQGITTEEQLDKALEEVLKELEIGIMVSPLPPMPWEKEPRKRKA